MLEFDIQKALLATYTGLGAAFVALAFLIGFTVVVERLASLRDRSVRASAETSGETPPVVPQQVAVSASIAVDSGLQETVATSFEEQEIAEANGLDDTEDAEPVDDWKVYGRLEAFSSRRVRRRGR